MENYDEYIGKQFGDYIIDKFINRGAWGIVFRAFDEDDGEKVALKILKPNEIALKQFEERNFENLYDVFKKEKIFLKKSNNTNIVPRYLNSYIENGEKIGYLVMPLYGTEENNYEDATLEFILKDKHFKNGLDLEKVDYIIEEILWGMYEVHDILNRCHSDIKPDNFIIEEIDFENDYLGKILVGDLGTSSTYAYEKINEKFRSNMGYIYTRSPENFRGEHPSYQSDVWAIGSLFYKILTGEYIFQKELDSIQEKEQKINFMKNLSSEEGNKIVKQKLMHKKEYLFSSLEEVLIGCLEFEPEKRYNNSREINTNYVLKSDSYKEFLKQENVQ
jgi:serine/threonine protein kinase